MADRALNLEGGSVPYLVGGSGPLVVLSHAFGRVAWGEVKELESRCTVAIPEWERSGPVEVMLSFDWFELLVRELGFDNATLCVWSMAGPAAVYYATDPSPRLSQLALVDCAGFGDGLPEIRLGDLLHLALTRLLGRPTRGFVRLFSRDWIYQRAIEAKPLEDAMLQFLRSEAAEWSPEDEDEDPEESLLEQLSQIKVPTLLLTGRHSKVLDPEMARPVLERIPRAEWILFEESAHALQLEESSKFQKVLARFVTGC